MPIAGNIERIEERIQKSCDRAGRKREEITLMGVSKFVPVNLIKEAFNCGVRCFGESRVKEAFEKFSVFKEQEGSLSNDFAGARIHLIGSLQRNKAKQAVKLFDCIQSVDRNELIYELVKQSAQRETQIDVLLELHTGEETKSGFLKLDDLFTAAEIISAASLAVGGSNLRAAGLMTMAPFTGDADLIRASFRQLVNAQKELEKRFPGDNWKCLSMGMSNDFEIAIEEGSTMLRIGSAIFRD